MWVVSTTLNWNVGDDLIREGVMRLLGLGLHEVVYYNRCRVTNDVVVSSIQTNMPPIDEAIRESEGLVIAGTPEWGCSVMGGCYKACLKHTKPVIIVGVGTDAVDISCLKTLSDGGLLFVPTARDRLATQALSRLGIRSSLFLDPAFHAIYPRVEKKYDVVLVYRAGWTNSLFDGRMNNFWLRIFEKYRKRVDLVVVHELPEVSMARRLFWGVRIFFSSEKDAYKDIYSRTAHCISGRIHGAIPVLASGGAVSLVYHTSKSQTLADAITVFGNSSLLMRTYGDDVELLEPKDLSTDIATDFGRHERHFLGWRAP